uniref:Ig-like domain-containing protein n=1 Tax=Malurus cyaneus samueli TaxID=2593467 RepID=A0A8C5TJT5_9PASS
AMELLQVLLAAALLPLLPREYPGTPLPTLTPPLSMVLAGQRRQLVVCVVSDLAPSSGHAVWIATGNGSVLQSFAYGASQEDGGTVCSVSLLSSDPLRERELACHVGANRTSPSHSSSPIHITGMTLLPPPLLRGQQGAGVRPTFLARLAGTGRGLWPALPHTWCWAASSPQLLFHPTGNEEAAELCSTAGESLAPAWWECQLPGRKPWQCLGWGSVVVGMGFPTVWWDWGRGEGSFTLVGTMGQLGQSPFALRDSMRVT